MASQELNTLPTAVTDVTASFNQLNKALNQIKKTSDLLPILEQVRELKAPLNQTLDQVAGLASSIDSQANSAGVTKVAQRIIAGVGQAENAVQKADLALEVSLETGDLINQGQRALDPAIDAISAIQLSPELGASELIAQLQSLSSPAKASLSNLQQVSQGAASLGQKFSRLGLQGVGKKVEGASKAVSQGLSTVEQAIDKAELAVEIGADASHLVDNTRAALTPAIQALSTFKLEPQLGAQAAIAQIQSLSSPIQQSLGNINALADDLSGIGEKVKQLGFDKAGQGVQHAAAKIQQGVNLSRRAIEKADLTLSVGSDILTIKDQAIAAIGPLQQSFSNLKLTELSSFSAFSDQLLTLESPLQNAVSQFTSIADNLDDVGNKVAQLGFTGLGKNIGQFSATATRALQGVSKGINIGSAALTFGSDVEALGKQTINAIGPIQDAWNKIDFSADDSLAETLSKVGSLAGPLIETASSLANLGQQAYDSGAALMETLGLGESDEQSDGSSTGKKSAKGKIAKTTKGRAGGKGLIGQLSKISGISKSAGSGIAGMMGRIGTAIGQTGRLFGGLITTAARFAAVMLTNPIVLIVAAIAAAAYLIYDNWGAIAEFFTGLWNSIGEGLSALSSYFAEAWAFIKAMFFAPFQTLIDSVKQGWSAVKNFFGFGFGDEEEQEQQNEKTDKKQKSAVKKLAQPALAAKVIAEQTQQSNVVNLPDTSVTRTPAANRQITARAQVIPFSAPRPNATVPGNSNPTPLTSSAQSTQTHQYNNQITINAPAGMNAEQLAAEISKVLEQREQQGRSSQRSLMYDVG